MFHSNSFPVQINVGASQSISNDKSHFESIEPLDTNDPAGILGLTGEESPIKGKGTIRWKNEDDNGMVHTIKLKNALYVLEFKTCLLCTQHWSQSMNNHFLTRNRTWQASYSDHIILYWDQHQFKRTVPWDTSTNTGYLRSTEGAIDNQVYSASINADNNIEGHEHACFNSHTDGTHLVSDDEQDEDSTKQPMTTKLQMIIPTVKQGRNILQISSQKNFQHSQQASSRMKMNLFLP
jgi:hypothetical protein